MDSYPLANLPTPVNEGSNSEFGGDEAPTTDSEPRQNEFWEDLSFVHFDSLIAGFYEAVLTRTDFGALMEATNDLFKQTLLEPFLDEYQLSTLSDQETVELFFDRFQGYVMRYATDYASVYRRQRVSPWEVQLVIEEHFNFLRNFNPPEAFMGIPVTVTYQGQAITHYLQRDFFLGLLVALDFDQGKLGVQLSVHGRSVEVDLTFDTLPVAYNEAPAHLVSHFERQSQSDLYTYKLFDGTTYSEYGTEFYRGVKTYCQWSGMKVEQIIISASLNGKEVFEH